MFGVGQSFTITGGTQKGGELKDMCRTPKLSWRLVYKALERDGYRIRTIKGSHLDLGDGANHNVTIPMYDVISPGSFLSISAQAGMEKERLAELCLKCKQAITHTGTRL